MEDRKKILVVEDMDGIRDLISATLRMRGFTIEKAQHGREAMKMLRRKPEEYDLIISDYDMPRMNGQELLEEVRAHSALNGKPFIMLTSRSEPEKIRAAKAKGLSAWITKPFKIDSFMSKIKYALRD